MLTHQLGRRVQEIRRDRGLTQDDLSDRAGLSYSTISKIERGSIKEPAIQTVVAIAQALGISIDSLIGKAPSKIEEQEPELTVRFVYFDVNGVMVRFFQRAFTALANDTGTLPEVVETTFWHYNDAVCTGKLTIAEFNRTLAQKLGAKTIDWQKYYIAAVKPVAASHQLAKELHKQGVKIGLLTNIFPGFLEAMFKKELLPNLKFDVIAESSRAGAVKPSSKIYEYAAREAMVPPKQILLIDDTRPNLIGAEKQGWNVLWFDLYHPQESIARVRRLLKIKSA